MHCTVCDFLIFDLRRKSGTLRPAGQTLSFDRRFLELVRSVTSVPDSFSFADKVSRISIEAGQETCKDMTPRGQKPGMLWLAQLEPATGISFGRELAHEHDRTHEPSRRPVRP